MRQWAIASAYTIPRVNLNVVKLHSEVNMVASGHSGLAARAHDLTSFHHVAFVYVNLADVAIDRL